MFGFVFNDEFAKDSYKERGDNDPDVKKTVYQLGDSIAKPVSFHVEV